MHGRSIAHLAGLGWATSMLAALLALGFGGTVFGASQRADPEVAAAWQELQLRLGRDLQVDGDPRQQLVTAMLLSMPQADNASANKKAATAARLPEAQAIFARVRAGSDDPWVLWVAGTDCRVGALLCDRDAAIDSLLRIEPENAAV